MSHLSAVRLPLPTSSWATLSADQSVTNEPNPQKLQDPLKIGRPDTSTGVSETLDLHYQDDFGVAIVFFLYVQGHECLDIILMPLL